MCPRFERPKWDSLLLSSPSFSICTFFCFFMCTIFKYALTEYLSLLSLLSLPNFLFHSLRWTDICSQPKEVGPCRGYFPRWYYDSSKGICLQFIYGGCRGNKNNFEHFEECNRMCQINSEGKTGIHFLSLPIFPLTFLPL